VLALADSWNPVFVGECLNTNPLLVAMMAKLRPDVVRGRIIKMLPAFVELDKEEVGSARFGLGTLSCVSQVISLGLCSRVAFIQDLLCVASRQPACKSLRQHVM